ncbi:hypothetical protein J2S41_007802 [Catenuloplanes atrovinosus]|uniref:Uncharacterized protein n=1 Tax=Catenuloplanes atrovinosus TaxID=137266 RepID=A0AAE4CFI4_9ACTN|nr:hypothetical protein [Catenuloplanes atrovinosus]
MRNRWVRAGVWAMLGVATGLVAGVGGNIISGEPPFSRTTWLMVTSLGIACGCAEFWRASRRQRPRNRT